jgi:hypothetical protein
MADPDYLKGLGINMNSLMSAPGSTGGGLNGTVYLGPKLGPKTQNKGPGPYAPGGVQGPGIGNYDYTGKSEASYDSAKMMPLQWDEKQKKDFISKGILYKIPGFSADMGMPEVMSVWDDLVQSSMAFSKGGSNWSPWDVMDSYKKKENFGTIRRGDWLYDAATGEKVKYVGPKTKTTTNKNINLSSAEDVKALTTQMLTELLGRAPTVEELAKYRASINGYENANPEITTTTSTLDDMGEVVSQSSKTTGGASQAAVSGLVTDAAKKGPEYGKFQSATTYYNALMQMITGG